MGMGFWNFGVYGRMHVKNQTNNIKRIFTFLR